MWLFSYWASYIDTTIFAFPALLSLGFLPLTLICGLFGLYWAFRLKWWHTLPFIIALFILKDGVSQTFAFQTSLSDKFIEKRLKVMTQNVEVFNVYAWQKIENARDKILKDVMEIDPDVLMFQEFYSHDKRGAENNNIEHFINLTALNEYHFSARIKSGEKQDRHFGVIIYSKYPIIKKGEIKLENTRNQIAYCDVQLPENKIVRVFNVHLQSIYFSHNEFDFTFEQNAKAPPSMLTKPLGILKKLKQAYGKRGIQTNKLVEAIQESPYPVILCGDFNDTPVSYTYNSLKKHLNDAFLQDGLGIGATYAGIIPALRIDYIFSDPRLEVLSFRKLNNRNADHYGLVTELSYEGL